ncbi:MAG: SgcJ/EcaC family oxidoreductase [Proteobacteria bacterium]|nr:SgcJ/EcaC family oxidoreductase [Pseudomonadota bacterium]
MPVSTIAEDAIRRLLADQIAAWNAGDAKAWCRDFTTDSGFVNILGMHFAGREANATRHAEMFATVFKGSRLDVREMQIRLLDEQAATADLVLDLSRYQCLPPGIQPSIGNDVLRTRMHYVLVYAQDHWQVVFSQNTAIVPLPPRA